MEYDFGTYPVSPGAFTGNEAGVYPTLTLLSSGGYTLTGAGAPESINIAGNFTYEFNGGGLLERIIDPSGNIQEITYVSGAPTQVEDLSSGRIIEFQYDTPGIIARVVEGGGEVITHLTYSGTKLTDVQVKNSLRTLVRRFEYAYNGLNLPSEVTQDGDIAKKVTITYCLRAER